MNTRPPDYPIVLSLFGRLVCRLIGWQVDGYVPDMPKFVVIGAPHTSNWDGIMLLLTSFVLRIRLYWLGKHTLFRPPFGMLMRWAGGVPVNRQISRNAVEQAVDAFHERQQLVLVIAPDGTRKKANHWKTGFYYIASKAEVPIVLGFLDYRGKRSGLGPTIIPSGDMEADLDQIRPFYADKIGRHPERTSAIEWGSKRAD